MVQQYRDDTDTQQLSPKFTDDQATGDIRTPTHRANVKTSPAAEVNPVYRGYKSGAAFFGWLIAVGLTVLLTGIVGAIAAAVDYAITIDWNGHDAGTIGIVSGVVLIVMMAIAYYNGGYVAGRLARFDGARQGFGVWAIGVIVTLVVAGIGALAGSQYDVLNRVNLPSVPIANDTLTTGGLIAAGAVLLVTLLAAVIGGKAGQRYHHRIDNSWG
jgi:heme/copper-type cytochrome/quinol oxidase subunit 1